MKAYLIKSSAPGPFKEYKKATGGPSQNIFSVAATTPAHVEVELCDETIGMKPKRNIKADIVALFFHTPDAVHAYKLADHYRGKGCTVVLGGLHPSFLPDEAAAHADTLLIGEAEGIWEELLHDVENGQLKKSYKRTEPVDLATVKPYPIDLIPPSKYNYTWSVLVSRGCVHKCEYCAVPPFFNGKYRLRPIENIVAEIKALPEGCWVELHADHLAANRDYSLELFKALKPLNVNWFGESTIKMADDDELLQAAADSGCKMLLIGIETPSQAALSDAGKEFVDPDQIRAKIRRFHDFGIEISSSMIFGFDSHTPEIFQETLDFCRHVEIDEVEAVLLIPFPGTPLYDRLDKEGRIIDRDWAKYDGSNVVFKPKNMSVDELNEGSDWFWREIQKKVPRKSSGNDSSGSASPTSTKPVGPRLTSGGSSILRWKSMLALAAITVSLVFDLYWIWGVLFVIWAINDLRNGYTHLLDHIPRNEAPILYWLVVLTWLGLGLWALLLSPVSYWQAQADQPAAIVQPLISKVAVADAETIPLLAGKGDKKQVGTAEKQIRDQRFNFTFEAPGSWGISETRDKDSITLDVQSPDKHGCMTVIAVDMHGPCPLIDFIPFMEKEIGEEFPLIKPGLGIPAAQVKDIKDRKLQMAFGEYHGDYKGHRVKALVGYAMNESIGYVLIATHAVADARMEGELQRMIDSFEVI